MAMLSEPNATLFRQVSGGGLSPSADPSALALPVTTGLLAHSHPNATTGAVTVDNNQATEPMDVHSMATLQPATTRYRYAVAGIGNGVNGHATFSTPGQTTITTLLKKEDSVGRTTAPFQTRTRLLSGSPVNGGSHAFIQHQQSSPSQVSSFSFPTTSTQNFIELTSSYNGFSATDVPPNAPSMATNIVPNGHPRAEMIKEPYVMIRNRYNTEGKRKGNEDGEDSFSEDAEDEEEEKEDDVDEEDGSHDEAGILGATFGKSQSGLGRGRKRKPKAKLASALIWSIPPEKASKKKSNKEEPASGHHTLAPNSNAGREKVRGEAVVVRLHNPPSAFAMRVSVVTNELPRPRPHAFQLTGQHCENGIYLQLIKTQGKVSYIDISFSKVGLTYTKWKNMDKFLGLRNSKNVNPFKAEMMLTIKEMKTSGKANKPGAAVKAVPIEPTEHRVKRRGRRPGRPKNSERRQKAHESQNQSAPAPAATGAPGPIVNHLKQFRLAFEFLNATSERDLKDEFLDSICPPLLSEPVFTDFEFLKIENVNPMTAYDSKESCIWIATSKLDYSNRPTTVRFNSPKFNGGFAYGSVVECHKQVLLIVKTPTLDTSLHARESEPVMMELVRCSGRREEVSNLVEITYKHWVPDEPESKPSCTEEQLEVAVGATDGLTRPDIAPDEGLLTVTNPFGAGAQFPAVQSPAQASPQVRLYQVADRPGLHAIMDQMGNVVQLVQTRTPQLNFLPPAAGIASPAALWAGAAATVAPTHTQLLGSLSPMAQEQQLNPYSVVATTAQSIQNAANLGLQQQQELPMRIEPEFSTLTTLGSISSADYGINPQLTQISPQTGASGSEHVLISLPSNALIGTEEQLAIGPSSITPLASGGQTIFVHMQPALGRSVIYN